MPDQAEIRPTIVFSDIHGCAEELEYLLGILKPSRDCRLVFLGDYVDRGEDSRGVIETVLRLKKRQEVVTLMGNHEQMLVDFLLDRDTPAAGSFIYNGGGATLANYAGDDGVYAIPEEHRKFLGELKLFHEDEGHFFVHAGVPPCSLADVRKDPQPMDLLWIREPFLNNPRPWEKLVVHGHTPMKEPERLPNRINIDTGCVFTGNLTALVLPEGEFVHVKRSRPTARIVLHERGSARRAVRFRGNQPVSLHPVKSVSAIPAGAKTNTLIINYNEFGVLLNDFEAGRGPRLEPGQAVAGRIGTGRMDPMLFEGRVVRIEPKATGRLIAVEFTRPPFDFFEAEGLRSGG